MALAAVLAGCHTEKECPEPQVGHRNACLGTVSVNLSGEGEDSGTKSVVSTDVEGFVDAYVFAFWADTKKICTHANKFGGESPISMYITEKSFEWDIPVGKDGDGREQHIDVWVIVNPDSDVANTLSDYVMDSDLCEDDLSALEYRCEDVASALVDMELEGTNMPMSGIINDLYLEKPSTPFTLTIRRLFSRYDLKLDYSRFEDEGWTVNAVSVMSGRANSVVPYFYSGDGVGYRASEDDLMSGDYASAVDINTINNRDENGKSREYITLYFLENCQGTILKDDGQPAQSWASVSKDLGDKVSCCSYLVINVRAIKDDVTRNFQYRLYLGQDFRSDFDIIRNKRKKVSVRLGEEPDKYFAWSNPYMSAVRRSETVREYYSTNIDPELGTKADEVNELVRIIKDNKIYNEYFIREYNYDKRYVDITPKSNCPLSKFTLVGGDASFAKDTKELAVQDDFYAGMRLGCLPLKSALGYPVGKNHMHDMTDYDKYVSVPDHWENPYLWRNTEVSGEGNLSFEEALYAGYDIKLENYSDGISNVKIYCHSSSMEENCTLHYTASVEGDKLAHLNAPVPAHCKVLIHAKEDVNDEWVTWFEFDKLVQCEYGLAVEASKNRKTHTENETTYWTGAVSMMYYCVGDGESGVNQKGYYCLDDMSRSAHFNIFIPKIKHEANYPDANGVDIFGVKGYNTTIDFFRQPLVNPFYTMELSLSDYCNGLAYEELFPQEFTPYFLDNTKPVIDFGDENISGKCTSEVIGDFILLPSDHLSLCFGDYEGMSGYPGYLLRKSSIPWHLIEEHYNKNKDEFVPSVPGYERMLRSKSFYRFELYPDAEYVKNTWFYTYDQLDAYRKYLPNFGMRISTIDNDLDDLYSMKDIRFDGNSGYVTVDGKQVKIEDVIDKIVFTVRYNSKEYEIEVNPTSGSQTVPFVWNDFAASGYTKGYCSIDRNGHLSGYSSEPPLPLKGWYALDSSSMWLANHVWDDVVGFEVDFKPGYGTYHRNGEDVRFDCRYEIVDPAIGACK